jgi:hypothetical protein
MKNNNINENEEGNVETPPKSSHVGCILKEEEKHV